MPPELRDKIYRFLKEHGPTRSEILLENIVSLQNAPMPLADRLMAATLAGDPRIGRDGRGYWIAKDENLSSTVLESPWAAFSITRMVKTLSPESIVALEAVRFERGRPLTTYSKTFVSDSEGNLSKEPEIAEAFSNVTRIKGDAPLWSFSPTSDGKLLSRYGRGVQGMESAAELIPIPRLACRLGISKGPRNGFFLC